MYSFTIPKIPNIHSEQLETLGLKIPLIKLTKALRSENLKTGNNGILLWGIEGCGEGLLMKSILEDSSLGTRIYMLDPLEIELADLSTQELEYRLDQIFCTGTIIKILHAEDLFFKQTDRMKMISDAILRKLKSLKEYKINPCYVAHISQPWKLSPTILDLFPVKIHFPLPPSSQARAEILRYYVKRLTLEDKCQSGIDSLDFVTLSNLPHTIFSTWIELEWAVYTAYEMALKAFLGLDEVPKCLTTGQLQKLAGMKIMKSDVQAALSRLKIPQKIRQLEQDNMERYLQKPFTTGKVSTPTPMKQTFTQTKNARKDIQKASQTTSGSSEFRNSNSKKVFKKKKNRKVCCCFRWFCICCTEAWF